MSNLWLKIRFWTKTIILGLVLVYVILFALNNQVNVPVWLWFGGPTEHSLLVVLLMTLLIAVVGTLLLRTTLKTLRQFREMKQRARIEQLERRQAEMEAKAAKLQQRPTPPESEAQDLR